MFTLLIWKSEDNLRYNIGSVSFFFQHESEGLNSHPWAWRQAPITTEPPTSHISMFSVFLKQRVIKSPWALEITHVVSIKKKSLIENKLPAALSLGCVSSATNKDWHGLLNCFFICWICFAYCVIIYSKNCYSVLNFLLYFLIIFIITSANI